MGCKNHRMLPVQSRCTRCKLAWRLPSNVDSTCAEGSTVLGIEKDVHPILASTRHGWTGDVMCPIPLAQSMSVLDVLPSYNYLYLMRLFDSVTFSSNI